MKDVKLNIPDHFDGRFFSPIRSQVDYVRLLLYASDFLLLDFSPKKRTDLFLRLYVDNTSRLYFIKKSKIFSVSFPLRTVVNKGSITSIESPKGEIVDQQIIAICLMILNDENFINSPHGSGYIFETKDKIEERALELIEEMFLFEPSYLRYDHDPVRQDPTYHPLNHIDVNYSSEGGYKLGLEHPINEDEMIHIIEPHSPCKYLKNQT